MLHTLWPRACDRTEVVCEWFFEPATMEADGFDPQDAVGFWDQVNREDWDVCEITQRGHGGARRSIAGRYTERGGRRARVRRDGRRPLPRGARGPVEVGAMSTTATPSVNGNGAATAARLRRDRRRRRPQRPHRRRLPRARRPARLRPRGARHPSAARASPRRSGPAAASRAPPTSSRCSSRRSSPTSSSTRFGYRPDPARPRVRDVRRRRAADPAAQRRAGHLRAGRARLAARTPTASRRSTRCSRRPRRFLKPLMLQARRPALGLQAARRRLRAAARGRPRRRA